MIRHSKRLVLAILRRFGFTIVDRRLVRRGPRFDHLTMEKALQRTAHHIAVPATIIDVGASNGMWTRIAQAVYPQSRYLLLEANPIHEEDLQVFAAAHPNVDTVLAAAGDREGEIYFDTSDPFGGVATHEARSDYQTLPMTTIDAEVQRRQLKGPYALKFDTHGFEVAILKGAQAALKETQLIIMECYNFRIEPDSLLFFEMCAYLAEQGFRPVDMCEPIIRTGDGALWQMDLFFIRDDHPLFQNISYEGIP